MSFDLALPLPVASPTREDTDAGAYLRQLLALAAPGVEIMAIARRPGVQSKVAVRGGAVSGDVLAALRQELDGERVEVVLYSTDPQRFIAAALGLQEAPPIVLKPHINHAEVLVGEIDLRGLNGWRGVNRMLASSLTGWRIHLRSVADTGAWRSLARDMAAQRAVTATLISPTRVELRGLHARLRGASGLALGQELAVRVTRMDPDEGAISVSRRLKPSGQLPLPQ